MTRYWIEWPPVHKLVAGFVGYDSSKAKSAVKGKDIDSDSGLSSLIAAAVETGLGRME